MPESKRHGDQEYDAQKQAQAQLSAQEQAMNLRHKHLRDDAKLKFMHEQYRERNEWRRQFTKEAMASLIQIAHQFPLDERDPKNVAKKAVEYSDALLDQLKIGKN